MVSVDYTVVGNDGSFGVKRKRFASADYLRRTTQRLHESLKLLEAAKASAALLVQHMNGLVFWFSRAGTRYFPMPQCQVLLN